MEQQTEIPGRLARAKTFARGLSLANIGAGALVPIVIGGSWMAFARDDSGATSAAQVTAVVSRQNIVSSVKAVGTVTFADEQEMTFNQKGTVAKVNFKEGDMVKKGQIIAELDASTVLADIRSAQLSVAASNLQLQQLQSDKQKTITDAQNTVKETERQLEQAKNDFAISQQKLPTDIASAERGVAEKKASLQQAQLELEKAKSTEYQNLASTAQDVLAAAEGLLDAFYSILTRDASARPPAGNYDLEIDNLLYNDPNLAHRVQTAYLDAVRGARQMHDAYGTSLATQRDPGVLLPALQDAHAVAQSVYQLAERTYVMMQGATIDTSRFTVSELNSLRSQVSGNRTKASDLMGQIETAQSNLLAASSDGGVPSITLKQKLDAVTSAQNALTLAQDNLKLLRTQMPGTLQEQQDQLAKLKEDLVSRQQALNSTTNGTDINIRLKQNDVAQRAASLQKTSKTIEDYQLKAPFDGVIRRMDYQVGDNLLDSGESAKSVSLENPDFLIVTVPLDQVDVVRVKKDMKAVVTFDAVPGQTFEGVIDEIDPSAVEQSGVVSYNVKVKLASPKDLTILSGMTATVTIETARKEAVLAVPNLAIKRDAQGSATVRLADGTTAPVQTGATDGRVTEILSGLQEGQAVASMNVSVSAASSAGNAQRGGGATFAPGGFGGGGNVRVFQAR